MSEMVERVARAMEPIAWAALGIKDTTVYANRRRISLGKARAAIEAMGLIEVLAITDRDFSKLSKDLRGFPTMYNVDHLDDFVFPKPDGVYQFFARRVGS